MIEMERRRKPLSIALIFCLMCMVSTYWQSSSTEREGLYAGSADNALGGLPNFHKVNENLYRGGQPSPLGFKKLREMGIKTVINLRGHDSTESEKEVLGGLGINYIDLPLNAWRRPTDGELKEFFDVVNDKNNWPVFVHCRVGADRTGAMIGAYRIAHDDWTANHAYDEMRQFGFHRFYFNLKHFVYDFEKDWRANHNNGFAIMKEKR